MHVLKKAIVPIASLCFAAIFSVNSFALSTSELKPQKQDKPPHQKITLTLDYDKDTKSISSCFNNGIWGIGFDYDMDDNYFYNPINPWQRDFGYCRMYDEVAPYLGMKYDTMRFEFPYEGKQWMIQIWKGKYGMSSGAEIGLYTKDLNSDSKIYRCADNDNMLPMSMTVYKDNEIYFTREKQPHWWLTGFVPLGKYTADSLRCVYKIDLKSPAMRKALETSLKEQGMVHGKDYIKNGTSSITIIY